MGARQQQQAASTDWWLLWPPDCVVRDQGHSWKLFAEEDFAAANELVVDPDAVFVADGLGTRPSGAGLKTHSRWRLKNIGTEGTAVDIEFDAQVAGIAEPGNLVAGLKNNDFGENTDEDRTVSHGGEFTVNS